VLSELSDAEQAVTVKVSRPTIETMVAALRDVTGFWRGFLGMAISSPWVVEGVDEWRWTASLIGGSRTATAFARQLQW
jgi:hypothetical protein